MDMKKIVYLPLDERPCNYDFPYQALEGSRYIRLITPPIELMGKKKHPANCDGLCDFIVGECRDADYLILSLDTLLYGGIIPSRLHYFDEETLLERLDAVKRIKRANPKLHISAFSLIMRCPCYSDSSEEPDYYATCGKEIFLYGQNEHRHRLGEVTEEEYKAEREKLSACFGYVDDYEARRRVNLSLLSAALTMVGEYIDEFTILQDDSNARGYTAMDREAVLALVRERGINLDTYPGADEAGMTLLARAATYLEKRRPLICVCYPREGACDVVPIYEDREIKKTVSAQIASAGCIECRDEESADILLFCNLNDKRTYDVYLSPCKQADEGYIPEFTSRIEAAVNSGRGVAVADVAYCNAGDADFVSDLFSKVDAFKLYGYAGWNTSSNTLGTVICQGVLRYLYGNVEGHRKFTARRVLDDVVYSALIRPKMRSVYAKDESAADLELIVKGINDTARDAFSAIAEKYEVTDVALPWDRLFEIRMNVKEK